MDKHSYTNDHDLLVALDTKVGLLVTDIRAMDTNLKDKFHNHEGRIRQLEDDHLQHNPKKQIKRIDALEAKVDNFWKVVGVASGIGAAVGIIGMYVAQFVQGMV